MKKEILTIKIPRRVGRRAAVRPVIEMRNRARYTRKTKHKTLDLTGD